MASIKLMRNEGKNERIPPRGTSASPPAHSHRLHHHHRRLHHHQCLEVHHHHLLGWVYGPRVFAISIVAVFWLQSATNVLPSVPGKQRRTYITICHCALETLAVDSNLAERKVNAMHSQTHELKRTMITMIFLVLLGSRALQPISSCTSSTMLLSTG